MKSQDLDLLQKQHKEKGIPPCWCQQRVIRRAERFKSSIAITPLTLIRRLPLARRHRALSPSSSQSQRGTWHPHIPPAALTKPALHKGLLQAGIEGFAAGLWRRTQFSQQRFFCLFFPHPSTSASAPCPLTTCIPPGKFQPYGCSPHSARQEPLGTGKPTSAN